MLSPLELTRCLFYPGHERGFNTHVFSEARTAVENCRLFYSEIFEICGSVDVLRSSITVFLNIAYCDMQCSDKAKGICIGNSMICSDIWHKYHE